MNTNIHVGGVDKREGTALVTVLCITFVLSCILGSMVIVSGTHSKITRIQLDTEKAFYVAEAGVEHAAQYIANGGTVPGSICGMEGEGSYVATIISGASITDAWHAAGGQININPNNSPDNEFSVTIQDGSTINRDMLVQDYPGFMGQATLVHVKPKGNGNQNGFTVDGNVVELENKNSYDIISDYMSVSIYNDNINTNGKAVGQWWISLAAAEATIATNGMGSGSGNIGQARAQYSMLSVGTVRGRSIVILRETVKQKTWAKYALWMESNNGIYFKAGEKFYGSIYSTEQLSFSGDPEFFGECTSAATTYGGSTNACIFHAGYLLGVSNQTMQKVSFSNLESKASLELEGITCLTFSGTNMLVTNSRKGWNNEVVGCSSNTVIYVKTATSGTSSNRPGDIYVAGTLDGRLTVVSERDIYITNHIYYAVDSKTNMLSDDALGMIAYSDIFIPTSAPSNLCVYSHMMATGLIDTNSTTEGTFKVINYDTRSPSGKLMVHGGIVQHNRGAVGTFNSWTGETTSGFYKDYTYDTRFETDPPPDYPPLNDQLVFGTWRQR